MVRVRAADASVARKVVPSVLGAPGTLEIKLANDNNAALQYDAIVINVDFSVEDCAIKLLKSTG
jgi:hypothetical protein